MKLINSLFIVIMMFASCGTKEPLSPRLNHVFVQVSDINRSVDFYTTAFDLLVTNDSVRHLVFTYDDGVQEEFDVNLKFLKFPGQDFVFELAETVRKDSSKSFCIYQHVGIDVRDIDQALKRAQDTGADILSPVRLLQTHGVEFKQAFLRGPDGEVIELNQIVSGVF